MPRVTWLPRTCRSLTWMLEPMRIDSFGRRERTSMVAPCFTPSDVDFAGACRQIDLGVQISPEVDYCTLTESPLASDGGVVRDQRVPAQRVDERNFLQVVINNSTLVQWSLIG